MPKSTVQNGKGSRPRNNYSKQFRDNYDEIDWKDDIRCCNCGLKLDETHVNSHPELYILYLTGDIEHKNCNFN